MISGKLFKKKRDRLLPFDMKQGVIKSNCIMEDFKIKRSKTRINITFKITQMNIFPVQIFRVFF